MSYERGNIARMQGYTPGEQLNDPAVIKLNTNENPYPPTPGVVEALKSFDITSLRKYPQPTAAPFREIAAKVHGVTPQNIIATNAGDELLRLVITTFVDPDEIIGVEKPTYSLYKVLARVQDARVHEIPLKQARALPEDFAERLNQANAKLAFLVNPHAPTGVLRSIERIKTIAQIFNGVLVIDEAYRDFVDPNRNYSSAQLIKDCPNVLLLRTLSKGYSLAGLRFGYGIGSKELVEPMQWKTKDSYNTDAIAQALACAALQDRDAAAENWATIRQSRDQLAKQLTKLGLRPQPSQANFLLTEIPESAKLDAKQIYESLKARKILVRYFGEANLEDKLRISIGAPDENEALVAALRELLQ